MRRNNEIPTFLLGLVILLAIFKNNLQINIIVLGTAIAISAFAIIIQLYACKRRLHKQDLNVSS